MRSIHWLLVLGGLVGCAPMIQDRRGETRLEHAGHTTLVFTNATPDRMCALYLSFDGQATLGDNWLPREGLPSGQSLEVKVKPGTYQAAWNTCKQAKLPYYAGTLISDTAFAVDDTTQLFAYVADTVAPTRRAKMRDFHKLVRFSGQEILPYGVRVTTMVAVAPPPAKDVKELPPPPKVDLSAFIDQKLVRKAKVAAATKKQHKRPKHKASLKRVHDVANARAGYVQRR